MSDLLCLTFTTLGITICVCLIASIIAGTVWVIRNLFEGDV